MGKGNEKGFLQKKAYKYHAGSKITLMLDSYINSMEGRRHLREITS